MKEQFEQNISFWKMHGCGNNFVVLSDMQASGIDWQTLSEKLLDRNYGVGGDGLMVIKPSRNFDFEVAMYNPDSSLMGMCGNGIRCAASYVVRNKLTDKKGEDIIFEVEGREIRCLVNENADWVRVDMGQPSFEPRDLPLNSDAPMIAAPLQVGNETFQVTCLSMGNPHCVTFVSSLSSVDLYQLGPQFENHVVFPKRTNVEFVSVVSKEHLVMRVWERGAGATLACGTGACATLVAAVKNGISTRRARVDLPGGQVEVEWEETSNKVFLSGPAEEVFRATFLPKTFSK